MSFGDKVGVPTNALAVNPAENGGSRLLLHRASPDYRFVPFDRLSAREANALADLRRDPNYCGVLQPDPATGLTIKAVCPETARLFELLQEPGPLPPYISDDPDSALAIARLLSDGILQIKQDSEWVCGPAAHTYLTRSLNSPLGTAPAAPPKPGSLASLSLRAIQHAAALETTDANELASYLFRYNSLPLTPQWSRLIPDRAALERNLQIRVGGQCRAQLDRNWIPVQAKTDDDPWLAWTSRSVPPPPKHLRTYKLYLSPHPAHIGSVLPTCLDAITRAGAFHWKIGGNIRGLLRPDKMVAYFSQRDTLLQCSEIVGKQLAGCPAQGVPFTAELGFETLLSWGSDPLEEEMVPDWLKRQSWRQSICLRLGSFLAVAKREKTAAIAPWQFAMERLRIDGVDVDTWTLASAAHPAEITEAIGAMTGPLVLPDDVEIVALADIPQSVREQIEGAIGDYAVTRPRSRVPSKVIDADAAALLREFKTPTTLVQGIVRYCKAVRRKPTEILDDIYPFLESCLAARLLVAPGADSARIQASLEAGARIADCQIQECVQVLADSELYRVRYEHRDAALKLARASADSRIKSNIAREAGILHHLNGRLAPRLLSSGETEDGRAYLLQEWIVGKRAGEAAGPQLESPNRLAPRVVEVCARILEAYACLHRLGVVHADVRGDNLLVTESEEIRIIDFGLSHMYETHINETGTGQAFPPRAGASVLTEPEAARAILAGSLPPLATPASDQYSVAALIYTLLCGRHYIDFSYGRNEMLQQISRQTPIHLAGRGLSGADALNAVLMRALEKDPAARFPDMAEMASAFRKAMRRDSAEMCHTPR